MAEVHEAVDETLGRRVAVKLLLPELAADEDFVARFRREARAAASLNHPNIVSVYDWGEQDGTYFIVMEYVDGPTLAQVIAEEGTLPEIRAAEIGVEIAAALAAAHQQGLVHRDVKPGNVLLSSAASNVKVVDFGIARAMSSQTDLTRPGTIVGSAAYLSPEQALGEEVGPPSDIYSLGAVLYAMATGQAPFVAESALAVAHQHVHEAPTPPSARNPAISPAFDAVVLRALAKEPSARQPSAEALRHDLLRVVDGATAPETTSPEATAVMTPPPASSSTRILTQQAAPVAGAPVSSAGRRNGAVIAAFLVALAVAAIAIVLAAINGNKSPQTTTTVPTTIPTTTTFRRPVVTVPRTTLPPTTETPTTEAPITITIFPPATTTPDATPTTGP
jgi:eukaryotic-like serine/threonine-protein kinase